MTGPSGNSEFCFPSTLNGVSHYFGSKRDDQFTFQVEVISFRTFTKKQKYLQTYFTQRSEL